MKTNRNSIFKTTLNLAVVCLISGTIIAVTYYFTAPIALKKSAELKNQSMISLVKEADSIEPFSQKSDWYIAKKGGSILGYIVPSETKGYGGTIKLLVAVSELGKVIDYTILSLNETPGLGDKTAKDPFRSQFVNKESKDLIVVKDPKDKQHIDAVTGATISSRAVTAGVKEAVEAVEKYLGGN